MRVLHVLQLTKNGFFLAGFCGAGSCGAFFDEVLVVRANGACQAAVRHR